MLSSTKIHSIVRISFPWNSVIKANLYGLFLNPLKYLWLIIYILRHNIRNPKVMCKILGIFPKTIYFTKIIKDKNIKHIHAHWATIPTVSALIISEILNIPFSFTAHAWDIYVDQTMLGENNSGLSERSGLRLSISGSLQGRLQIQGWTARRSCVPEEGILCIGKIANPEEQRHRCVIKFYHFCCSLHHTVYIDGMLKIAF